MKLIQGNIRPGTVLELIDGSVGCVKVSAQGIFTDADGTEVLPPVYPWPFGYHRNSFSCPVIGEEIWLLSFNDNPMQLYWAHKDDLSVALKDLPTSDAGQNLEVVLNREYEDSKWAILYFDNGDGWMMKKGEDGLINIREDGSILLKTKYDKRIIDICEDSISLGTEGKAEDNAMLFGKWKEWMQNELCGNVFGELINLLNSNPYTAPVAIGFKPIIEKFKQTGDEIKSNHISITSN